MAGTNKSRVGDDDVYEAVTTVLPSGVLVIPSSAATVNPGVQGVVVAGDAAKNVLGVSARRANPVSLQVTQGTNSEGFEFTDISGVNELTTVYAHAVVKVTYTAAAVAFGAKLAAAAGGSVRAWLTADGADAVVGTCRVVGGMSSAGGLGFAKINV